MVACWNRFDTDQLHPALRPGHVEAGGQTGAQVGGPGVRGRVVDQSSLEVCGRDV